MNLLAQYELRQHSTGSDGFENSKLAETTQENAPNCSFKKTALQSLALNP